MWVICDRPMKPNHNAKMCLWISQKPACRGRKNRHYHSRSNRATEKREHSRKPKRRIHDARDGRKGANRSELRLTRTKYKLKAGADPGEVKWVNFQPPTLFLSPPSFFLFFSSLKYWNNIWILWFLWFLWFLWLRWRRCVSDDWFYQSIYSFWAHKHTVKNSPQKLQQFAPHFKILDPHVPLHYCLLFGWYNSLLVALYWFSCPCKLNLMCRVKPSW